MLGHYYGTEDSFIMSTFLIEGNLMEGTPPLLHLDSYVFDNRLFYNFNDIYFLTFYLIYLSITEQIVIFYTYVKFISYVGRLNIFSIYVLHHTVCNHH